jgi:hypothetical protein
MAPHGISKTFGKISDIRTKICPGLRRARHGKSCPFRFFPLMVSRNHLFLDGVVFIPVALKKAI